MSNRQQDQRSRLAQDKAATAATEDAAAAGTSAAAAVAAAGAKAKALLPPLPFGDDTDGSQPDQQPAEAPAQIALMSRLQSVLEADDDAADSEGFEDLQVALQRVIKNKAAKNQQKQHALLQETQTAILQQAKALEVAAAKDHKDITTLSNSTFNSLAKKLAEKFKNIEALNQKYQQDLHSCWEEYNEIYSQLDDAKDQVLAVAQKRQAALKRKISALQASSREKLAEAEKKMTKISSQATKLPNLSNMLKAAFM